MQHLEVSGAVVQYIGCTVSKGYVSLLHSLTTPYSLPICCTVVWNKILYCNSSSVGLGYFLVSNARSSSLIKLEIVHGCEGCNSTTYGRTSTCNHWMCWEIHHLDGTLWEWCQQWPKKFGVLVKQSNYVYEKWWIKWRLMRTHNYAT
jgi:hypothetical protein